MMSRSVLERPWKVQFLLCGWNFCPCRTAQPGRGSNQLLQWQWPFASSNWDFTETLTQQFLACSTSAAWRVGEKYSYIHCCIHLLCAHHPPPNKRNKYTSYRLIHVWVWKNHSLAASSSSAWVVGVKDEPDLILPAFPHHPPCLTHTPCCLKSNAGPRSVPGVLPSTSGSPWFSTALAAGSREVAQAQAGGGEQPSHQLAAGGTPQLHRCTGALGSCPCFS